jgi:spermidine synthase
MGLIFQSAPSRATDLWYTEPFDEGWRIAFRIRRTLYSGKSRYQQIDVFESETFGKILVLDGMTMLTERDEFGYHEMLVHLPMFTHPRPERVLIIGGGDGGTLREVLKHPCVKEAVQVEIDAEVMEVSKRFLPGLASGFSDPQATVVAGDGISYVKEAPAGSFDLILVDSTDPVGPAEGLFSKGFYGECKRILNNGGMVTVQSGSPLFQPEVVRQVSRLFREIFPVGCTYLSSVPAYGGPWSFTLGSLGPDPHNGPSRSVEHLEGELRYYTSQLHLGALALPRYVREMVEGT